MKRVYTAVFRPWHKPYAWFKRDSGLVTEGLRRNGVESRLVILDTPGMDGDERFLPASREQFCDPAFWRALDLDGVVLQGGADPGIDPVSQAIRGSGTRLLLRLDTDGVVAPQVDPYLYCYTLWWWLAYHRRHPAFLLALGKAGLKTFFPRSFGPGRIVRRLQLGDGLLVESRVAAARLQRLLTKYGAPQMAGKVAHLPIPVADEWGFPDKAKEDVIVSVARWNDAQKDAPKLVRVLSRVLPMHPSYRAIIIGDGEDFLRRLVKRHAADVSARIQIAGRLAHEEIAAHEGRAKIFVCSSRAESMSIATAEALCCGCSVVGAAEIAAMQEYASPQSGTLAWTRRDADLADAVCAEIGAWAAGERKPREIRERFCPLFSAAQIASRITGILGSSAR